jgi:predicted N-acetyltransferase YhbS
MRIEYLANNPALIPTVAAWQYEQFGYLSPATTLEQRVERLQKATASDALPLTMIALSDCGMPMGSASLTQSTLTHNHLTPWLSAVFVRKAHRGKGIASTLAARALAEASRLGFEKLYIFTPLNEALYFRLGWRTFDTSQIRGIPVVLMECTTWPTKASNGMNDTMSVNPFLR